jgi:hypothetical protein
MTPEPALTDEGKKCVCPAHCIAGVLISFGGAEMDMRTAKCSCICHAQPTNAVTQRGE